MARRRDRHGLHEGCLAGLLIALAAMGQPILTAMLSEWSHTAALIAPSIACVTLICLICPDTALPILSVLSIYAVEFALLGMGKYPAGASIVREVFLGAVEGDWGRAASWGGVPAAAVAMGGVAVMARRRMPLWGKRFRTNLRILDRRPLRFVRAYRWGLLALLFGLVLDTVTTMRFMYRWGPSAELHPAMQIMARQLGVTLGVPVASAVRAAFVVFVAAIWRPWTRPILYVTGVLYTLAAASNHFGWL